MNELEKKMSEIATAFENLRSIVFADLVTWDKVESIKLGETVLIDKTFNKKLYEDENCMIFKTTIPAGVTFPSHFHNFTEQNIVIEGELEDVLKKYKREEWMVYTPYTTHEISNTTDKSASIIVIFTR